MHQKLKVRIKSKSPPRNEKLELDSRGLMKKALQKEKATFSLRNFAKVPNNQPKKQLPSMIQKKERKCKIRTMYARSPEPITNTKNKIRTVHVKSPKARQAVNEESKVSLPAINTLPGRKQSPMGELPSKISLKKTILANNPNLRSPPRSPLGKFNFNRKSGKPGSRNDLDPLVKRSLHSPSPGYNTR